MAADIWPDFDLTKTIRTPRDVLKEQHQQLQLKTKGVLGLKIGTTSHARKGKAGLQHAVAVISYTLIYAVEMFRLEHGLLEPYPAEIWNEATGLLTMAPDEAALVKGLREIVTSTHWTEVIDRLLAMSQSNVST